MVEPELYSEETLLSLYKSTIETNIDKLVDILYPGTLVPYTKTGIITDEEKVDLGEFEKTEQFRRLIKCYVLGRDNLDCYIRFSRCVEYSKKVEAKRIFPFIKDLFQVGLHDPLRDPRSYVKCRERSPGEEAQPVVLWIIAEESMFQVAKKSISGRRHHTLDGYLCEKSTADEWFDLYIIRPKAQSTVPGKKFDSLLAQFEPCPSLVVYSGECLPVNGASASPSPDSYVIVSSPSDRCDEYDKSPEAHHISELCKLKRCQLEGDDFLFLPYKNIQIGKATRYSHERGALVHCPDGISVHQAAKKCSLPVIVVTSMVKSGQQDRNVFFKYMHHIIKEII